MTSKLTTAPLKQVHKSRSYICARTSYGLRKLIWVNEDVSGIYVGLYREKGNDHYSYHADGHTHYKVKLNKQELRNQDTPISEIEDFRQIITSIIGLRQGKLIRPGVEYQRDDPKTSTAIFLDLGLLPKNSLAVSVSLISREFEMGYLKSQFKISEVSNRRILAMFNLSLRFFPHHKLGVLLSE